ncbi:hypothetical protein OG898_04960 [Streptomyces sp. NBC_00193]|uniref:hypothetical protein n=1 Tax=Streptomyces sp. NBC_00193 TaxID=2975675 RepID=UPI00224F6675|nr:hypothetical protein [Streptomyces sp. NBC_00193]MCX5295838.1 hypothetical protein [Streptomyces sp. NBC_00193]
MTTPPEQPAPNEPTDPGGWASIPPATPDERPSHGRTWLAHGATAFAALIVGVTIGASGGSGGSARADGKGEASAEPQPTVTVTVTASVTATPAAQPAPTMTMTETVTATPEPTKEAGPATRFAGNGEYLVGEDIKPGTYKTDGPAGSFGCYWERAKDSSGEFDSIIANNNLAGPGRVTLRKGEVFKTTRCQEWQSAS